MSSGNQKDIMKILRPVRLKQLKVSAKLLHKSLQTDFTAIAPRYLQYPPFHKLSLTELSKMMPSIGLKHAYQVIAAEYGYATWEALKNEVVRKDMLFRTAGVGLIHKWFKNYTEARQFHSIHGGYLLQCWGDYIICGTEYVQLLQLDQYLQDWALIGYNWIEPLDTDAYQRLYAAAIRCYTSY